MSDTLTHEQICDALREYAKLLAEPIGTGYPRIERVEEDLTGLADALEAAHDPEQKVWGTARDLRVDLGLCPDGGEHWWGECGPWECPTWRQHLIDNPEER